jgi:hypothetical protein
LKRQEKLRLEAAASESAVLLKRQEKLRLEAATRESAALLKKPEKLRLDAAAEESAALLKRQAGEKRQRDHTRSREVRAPVEMITERKRARVEPPVVAQLTVGARSRILPGVTNCPYIKRRTFLKITRHPVVKPAVKKSILKQPNATKTHKSVRFAESNTVHPFEKCDASDDHLLYS